MIDTVKFKIQVEDAVYKEIESNATVNVNRNNIQKEEWVRYLKEDITIGSYDRKVTLFSNEKNSVYLECSLPKQYFGDNVRLLYPLILEEALLYLQKAIEKIHPNFTSYKKWKVVRLDLCYAWKFPEDGQAEKVLDMLKHLEYPRKHRYVYKTAVMFKGRHYSIKFYLKQPEFMRHDFPEIHKKDPQRAGELMLLSQNILRFEVTYRKEQLKNLFENKNITYKDLLNFELLESFMNNHIKKLLKNRTTESMNDEQIVARLKETYKPDKAMRLFNYYKQYYSEQEHMRQIIKSNYSASTIWRNNRDIAQAKIGITSSIIDFNFDLSIPSTYVVNTALCMPAAAGIPEEPTNKQAVTSVVKEGVSRP